MIGKENWEEVGEEWRRIKGVDEGEMNENKEKEMKKGKMKGGGEKWKRQKELGQKKEKNMKGK